MTRSHHSEPEYRARIESPRSWRFCANRWQAIVYRPDGDFAPRKWLGRSQPLALAWACAMLRRLADDIKVGGSE